MADKPKAGIIGGAGMMGSHMAELCRRLFEVNIFDIDGDRARTVSKEAGCRVMPTAEELVEKSDLTIFAVPTNVVEGEMRRLIPIARPGSCITDVTSVKAMPMKAMAESAPDRVDYFGMHPNYRATVSPYNQTIVICPGRPKEVDEYRGMVERIFIKKGARITYMDPKEADFYSDLNQNLIHDAYFCVMTALMRAMDNGTLNREKLLATATPTSKRFFENAGRILGGKPHVYAGIQFSKSSSPDILDGMIESLKQFRELIFSGGAAPEETQRQFEQFFLSLRDVLGEQFVAEACAKTDQEYEVPGGLQIYYRLDMGFGGETEKFLRTIGAKNFQQYKEQVRFTSIPSGSLNTLSGRYAVAKTRIYKYEGAEEGATAFYCSNKKLSPDKKGIRFSQATIVNPDKLRGMKNDELYETVITAIRDSDERDPYYDRVQLLARYDDHILRFYDTIENRGDLNALGPWVVSKS